MELELKHLTSYLPYNIDILVFHKTQPPYKTKLTLAYIGDPSGIKLILHPLSNLRKKIKINEGYFIPINDLRLNIDEYKESTDGYDFRINNILYKINQLPYYKIQLLLKWHFDIFDLIKNNLAIDINTLNEK